ADRLEADPFPRESLLAQVSFRRVPQGGGPAGDEEDGDAERARALDEVQSRLEGRGAGTFLPGAETARSPFEIAGTVDDPCPSVHLVGRPIGQRGLVDIEDDGRALDELRLLLEPRGRIADDSGEFGVVGSRCDVALDALLRVE